MNSINIFCFYFPYLWEGFPNALAKAMVYGVLAVSSDYKARVCEVLMPVFEIKYKTTDFRIDTIV